MKNIYKAKIINIKKNKVIIDAKLKTLYNINISDFTEEELKEIQDKEIEVYIHHLDPLINKDKIASYKKAKHEKLWKNILIHKNQNIKVLGKIINSTKGGYNVLLSIGNINAFLPISHMTDTPEECFVNKEILLKIIGVNKLHKNIIVSKKEVELEELEKVNKEKINILSVGSKLYGVIKGVGNNTLFINIGCGYSGIVYSQEATFQYDVNLNQIYSNNQKVSCVVIEIDENNKKLILSINQTKENPFILYTINTMIDVLPVKIIQDYSMESSETKPNYTLLCTTIKDNLSCKINFNDNRYLFSQALKLIEEKEKISCKVKYVDYKNKCILATTKRSIDTIWKEIQLKHVQSKTGIFDFTVIGKSKFMLFLAYNDFETIMPMYSLSHINTAEQFESIEIGQQIKAKIIYLNINDKESMCSTRAIYEDKILVQFDALIEKRNITCKLAYKFGINKYVLLAENCLEIIIIKSKIPVDTLQEIKNNPKYEFKMTIESFNKNTLHLELIPYMEYNNEKYTINSISLESIVKEAMSQIKEDTNT